MGRIGFPCRHDVTPRSACKLCRAEDDRMRRPPKRKQFRISIEETKRILAEEKDK
jgi:hypothetical protein